MRHDTKTLDQRLRANALAALKLKLDQWRNSFFDGTIYSSDLVSERNITVGELLDSIVKAKMEKSGPIVAQQAVDDFLSDFEELRGRVDGLENA